MSVSQQRTDFKKPFHSRPALFLPLQLLVHVRTNQRLLFSAPYSQARGPDLSHRRFMVPR